MRLELGKLTAARMQHVDLAWGSSKDPAAELKKSSVIGLADSSRQDTEMGIDVCKLSEENFLRTQLVPKRRPLGRRD